MIVIFYFSGTGNTRYAAIKLCQFLQDQGANCEVYSIETITPEEASEIIRQNHTVLFGYPVYGSYTCELMVKFLKNLIIPSHTNIGFFCTQMMFSGDGARVGHDLLQTKASTMWGIHINMPNNLNCGAFSFLPISNNPARIRRRYLNKADKKLSKLARQIMHKEKSLAGFSTLSRLLGLIQRPGYIKVYKDSWHAAMQIDQQRCTSCGQCIRQCPAGNIKLHENQYRMLDQCVLCLRCYNFCPEKAVIFLGRAHPEHKDRYQGLPDA